MILHKENNKYPKKFYSFLRRLSDVEKNKGKLSSGIKHLLYRYGVQYVLINQDVEDAVFYFKRVTESLISILHLRFLHP